MAPATTPASRAAAPSGSGASNKLVAPAMTTASRGTATALSWTENQTAAAVRDSGGYQLAAYPSRRDGRATLAASLWAPSRMDLHPSNLIE
jgi:hypothetical protein